MKILAGNSNRPLAEAISAYLNLPLTKASVRRFSDMEIFVAPIALHLASAASNDESWNS